MADGDRFSEEKQAQIKTILVVDDNADIGAFIVAVLTTEAPYRALFATDGLQAQEVVKTLVPDLFILDYQLPQISGL